MSVNGAQKQITEAVYRWPETTVAPHRFGGVEYQIGTREIGHIHGDTLVDIPFPTPIRNELVDAGIARPHHVLPDSGWISFYIRQPEDINQAIALLQRSYQLAKEQAARRYPKQKADHDSQ
jgi:predicted DNA-binding protein (MmcQ/YjbR family)